jgi:hypothetical protein
MKTEESGVRGANNNHKHAIILVLLSLSFLLLVLFVSPYVVGKRCHRAPGAVVAAFEGTKIDAAAEKKKLEIQVKDWLNTKEEIKELQLECLSVTLTKESATKYTGLAQFYNGEKTEVEVTSDNDSYLFHAQMPKGNPVPRIKNSTLSDYESTNIGKAFDAFFAEPKWEFKEARNGARFVEFTGTLKKDIPLSLPQDPLTLGLLALTDGVTDWKLKRGDLVTVRFAISSDDSSFGLWSMKINDGEETRYDDFESMKRIEEILDHIYAID